MFTRLNPLIDRWYFADLPTARAAKAVDLQTQWQIQNQSQNTRADVTTECFENPQEALQAARQNANPTDRIVVFGSFYTVGGVLSP